MVAVTGATGHLGTVLVHRLIADGEEVRYVARPTSDSRGLYDLPAGTARRVDAELFDVDALARAFDGAAVVYHVAGMISFMRGDGEALHRVNVEGTKAVLAAARRAAVPRLVYVGTIEAFSLEDGDFPITEETPIDPDRTVMDYGRTKALAMQLVLASGTEPAGHSGTNATGTSGGTELATGTPAGTSAGTEPECVVCAPTAFLGPPDYRLSSLGRFVLDTVRGRLPLAVNGGFDFVDVRDVADGVVRAGERGASGRVYLLGGEYATIPDIIGALEEASGVARPLVKLPVRAILPFAGIVHLYCRITGRPPRFTRGSLRLLSLGVRVDSSRARDELGYQTRPLRETLSDTVGWFADEGLVRLDAAWDAGADRATGPAE
ncbi:MAG: NAD-dependent epimerase/dehydratase family protein [Spirochaetota bacterium]